VAAPTIETGMASTGMIVARRLLRNTRMTSTTSATAISRVSFTSWIDSLMNSDESYATSSDMPRERSSRRSAAPASPARHLERARLACLTMPSPMAGLPLCSA